MVNNIQNNYTTGLTYKSYINNSLFTYTDKYPADFTSFFDNNKPFQTGKISIINIWGGSDLQQLGFNRNDINISRIPNTGIAVSLNGYFCPDISGIWKIIFGKLDRKSVV